MDKELKIELNCTDAIDGLKNIRSETVDLIVTDPPYYGISSDHLSFEQYLEFSKQWLLEAKRILKPTGTIYVFMGMQYISYIYQLLDKELGFLFNSWITWYYTQGIGKTKGFSPRHDDILMFTKSSNFTFNLDAIRIPQKFYRSVNNMRGANPGNVWEFSHVHYCNQNRQSHPTQKPEGLIERMVLASSNIGDLVVDPFVGSGTSARVCQQLNRNFIGFDNNSNYITMARERLKQPFTGFDSIDTRMYRVPNDLNNIEYREEYIKNHIQWFLHNHENMVEQFLLDVKTKYPKK